MRQYRGVKIALFVLVLVLSAGLAGAWAMFGPQLTAANSIEKLDGGRWAMGYRGDCGFNEFLAQGGASSDAEMADCIASFLSHGFFEKPDTSTVGGNYGCSAPTATTPKGSCPFGRNYDWADCDAMVIHTVPKDGYISVSTCGDWERPYLLTPVGKPWLAKPAGQA